MTIFIPMIKIAFIVNGSRKLSPPAYRAIELVGKSKLLAAEVYKTTRAKEATLIAERIADKYEILVAVGGDGTCNEVVQGIMISKNQAVRFGIIPNGTGNDFMQMLPPFEPKSFVKALESMQSKPIDIGAAEFGDSRKFFLNISDIGFGAEVVRRMNRQRKLGVGGKVSYAVAILRTFLSYRKKRIRLVSNEFEFEGKFLLIAFCNGHTFGHGLTIHPGAEIDNGRLGITVIGDVSLLEYIRNLKNLKSGKRIQHKEVQYHSVKSIKVESSGTNCWMEGDGELMGIGLKSVEVVEQAIQLIHQ